MIDDILPLNIVQTALSLTKLDRFTLAEQVDKMILFLQPKIIIQTFYISFLLHPILIDLILTFVEIKYFLNRNKLN